MQEELKHEVSDQSHLSIGELLRQTRESQQLTRQDVANRLNLRLSVVKAIEEEHFDSVALPRPYIMGYLHNYCRLLELEDVDLETVVAQLPEEPRHMPKSYLQSASDYNNKPSSFRTVTLALLIAVVGLGVMWWQGKESEAPLSDEYAFDADASDGEESLGVDEANQQASQSPAQQLPDLPNNTSPPVLEVVTPAETNAVDTANTTIGEQTQAGRAQPNISAQPSVPESYTENPYATNNNATVSQTISVTPQGVQQSIRLSFAKDCWVNVKDATGEVLAFGLKRKGEDLTLSGKKPFSLILGNAPFVNVYFNGEKVDITNYTRQGVARFELN